MILSLPVLFPQSHQREHTWNPTHPRLPVVCYPRQSFLGTHPRRSGFIVPQVFSDIKLLIPAFLILNKDPKFQKKKKKETLSGACADPCEDFSSSLSPHFCPWLSPSDPLSCLAWFNIILPLHVSIAKMGNLEKLGVGKVKRAQGRFKSGELNGYHLVHCNTNLVHNT